MTVSLTNITSGYSTGLINKNFQDLQKALNEAVLWRDQTELGQANQMEHALDMNANPILNASVDLGDPGSVLTVGEGDGRYVNVSGDSMRGPLDMGASPTYVRTPIHDNEPARKDQLDSVESGYQAGDSNLQEQLSGGAPLEASAFSPISWHKQSVDSSVTIPNDVNAWSFGPVMTIAAGQAVAVGTNSFWTIANGEQQ